MEHYSLEESIIGLVFKRGKWPFKIIYYKLCSTVYAGPFGGAVLSLLGPSYTYFTGVLLMLVAIVVSIFSINIAMMTVIYGVVNGIGASLMVMVTATACQHFFVRNKGWYLEVKDRNEVLARFNSRAERSEKTRK